MWNKEEPTGLKALFHKQIQVNIDTMGFLITLMEVLQKDHDTHRLIGQIQLILNSNKELSEEVTEYFKDMPNE